MIARAHLQKKIAHAARESARVLWQHRIASAAVLVILIYSAQLISFTLPTAHAAYTIANSARFISGNSDYVSRTPAASGNRSTFTYSFWMKLTGLNAAQEDIIGAFNATNDADQWGVLSSSLWIGQDSSAYTLVTSPVFRDYSAWYHVVIAVDTTQATASNRVKMYVNGSQITSFSSASYPSQNYQFHINQNIQQNIGQRGNSTWWYDGYLSDMYFIDGQQLDPTNFGQVDANGYWRAKAYSGTYGTNGFHLDFSNGSSLGTDTSGNGNNFTSSGLTANDQVIDTPTNGFATLNPLDKKSTDTLSNGNLQGNLGNGSGNGVTDSTRGSFFVSSGKWYWEVTDTAEYVSVTSLIGVANAKASLSGFPGSDANGWGYYAHDGSKYTNSVSTPCGAAYTTNDVIGVALDMDNASTSFYKNGVWQCQFTGMTLGGGIAPAGGDGGSSGSVTHTYNFGQGGQSGLTYDSASGGSFKYTPPSGFKALSTSNLPAPTVAVPRNYFDTTVYQGTGATQTITGSTTVVSFTSTATTTWTVPTGVTSVSVLVIGGGGGGGARGGGGGGAGGYQASTTYAVTAGSSITVAVGAGGAGGILGTQDGQNGISSTFGSITSQGGGGGTNFGNGNGKNGASGGGDWGSTGGTGIAGQGNSGGNGTSGSSFGGTGGGGAGAAGGANSGTTPGNGGAGTASSITGSSVTYAGGGGGGGELACSTGGAGGGGAGHCDNPGTAGVAGTNGLGGGGGGGSAFNSASGGAGGSGIVIVRYVPSISFQPDLVWIKDRTASNDHALFDSARGATNVFYSNRNSAEVASSTSLTAFTTNGFTLGVDGTVNTSAHNYVSWLWKKSPTIDGVDIVTYTGTGVARTIAHSLGAAPDMIIVKRRDSTGDSVVYHSSAHTSPQNVYLSLDATTATTSDSTMWNNTAPTASVFSVGNNSAVNAAPAYIWTQQTGSGARNWDAITSSSDGTKLAATENSATGSIYTSTDSGVTWTQRTNAGARNWIGIASSADGTKLVATANNDYIYTSTDSGATWTQRTGPGIQYWDSVTSSSDGTKLAATVGDIFHTGDIFTSTDSGATWTDRTGAGTKKWGIITSSSDGTKLAAVVVTGSDYVYTSADSGATWTQQTGSGSRAFKSITSSADGTKLAASVATGYIYTSTDSGVTWTEQQGAGSQFWNTITSSSDGTKLAVGSAASYMYTSSDSGVTWTQQTSAGTGHNWFALTSSSDGSKLAVAVKTASDYIYTGVPGSTTYVAYLFKGVDGFSKFGSYTGNGAADGPFVYTGFKPRLIMIKRADGVGDWWIYDAARDSYNPASHYVYWDSSAAESNDPTGEPIDILSNGFKIRLPTFQPNTSGATFLYAAFADVPFKYSAGTAAIASSGASAAIALLVGMIF